MSYVLTALATCGIMFLQPYNLPEIQKEEIMTVVSQVGERVDFSIKEQVLTMAIIIAESGGRPDALSHKAALGLMQLTAPALVDATEHCGLPKRPNVHTIRGNILAGMCYLAWQKTHLKDDTVLNRAIAYNAGLTRVEWSIRRLPRETVDYAMAIQKSMYQCYGGGL